MMLVLVLLSQNLNTQPIEVRQNGARVPTRQRQYIVDCRSNMTCAVDGGILFLSSSGSSGGSYDGGKVGEAYAADASIYANQFAANPTDCAGGEFANGIDSSGNLTCAAPPGSSGKVAEAYMADASITAQVANVAYSADASYQAVQLASNPTDCAAGQFASGIDQSGNLTCGTPDSGVYMTVPVADGGSIPMRPWAYENNLGFGMPLLPTPVGTSDVVPCRYVIPNGFGLSTLSAHGVIATVIGSQSTATFATTNLFTRTPNYRFFTSAALNSGTGARAVAQHAWRGSSAGAGGFLWWTRIQINSSVTTQRMFFGLKNSTSVITTSTDPNVITDAVYFGANSAATELSVCSNDNSGTATCSTLGTSFPSKTAGASYDMWLWAAPNASSVGYAISRIDSAASTYGTISSDLPRDTVSMGFDVWMGNSTTGTSADFNFAGVVTCSNL